MTYSSAIPAGPLANLGWRQFFGDQIRSAEKGLSRQRIATVHRSRLTAQSERGPVKLGLPHQVTTTDFAIGDWVLADPQMRMVVRRLERHSLLQRQTEGRRTPKLIAANIDTLFIVTSCNEDFNDARLERYLALAGEAGATPVIVLTKVDQVVDAAAFEQRAAELQRGLAVIALNAKSPDAMTALAGWCGPGQTVALVGSSGVGKSTLLNTLAAKAPESAQPTGTIRESDAKGRHTTTSRSLHPIPGGGWLIDTPGIRTLHMSDVSDGLDTLFAEITELAPQCRFRDCSHLKEPGCAVQAAVAAGALNSDRLDRWRKLLEENHHNTSTMSGPRGNKIPQFRGDRR